MFVVDFFECAGGVLVCLGDVVFGACSCER